RRHTRFSRDWSSDVCSSDLRRQEPEWAELSIELKKPGVTLLILWEEYRSVHPDGYGYSRFCELFRGFEQRLSPTMRQEHAAGDKVFVDYSRKKVPIVDRKTGEARPRGMPGRVIPENRLVHISDEESSVRQIQHRPDTVADGEAFRPCHVVGYLRAGLLRRTRPIGAGAHMREMLPTAAKFM